MNRVDLLPHLFRTEYRNVVSVLCKRFGFDRIEEAEDLASETFLTAAQTWGIQGIPPNPVAWIHRVAQNKALTVLQRDRTFRTKVAPVLKETLDETGEIDWSPQHIADSQLQMMFAVCHPSLPPEAQIGLSLRILCGFGIDEIADAFLTSRDTVNKRLYRAREQLRTNRIPIEMPDDAGIVERLESVLRTIYLLFNEGYYSSSRNEILRKDLCFEAIRLCRLLVDHERTDRPEVSALLALMCFHASRFDARFDTGGELVLYDDQDVSRWDNELVGLGAFYLRRASGGNTLSRYHLEAAIAWWHTQKTDSPEKWEHILQLYNLLLQVEYSPIAALNRTYALARARGKENAIAEAEKLKLTGNHFYYTLLGELYTDVNDTLALQHLHRALELARTDTERQIIRKKIASFERWTTDRTYPSLNG